MGHVTAACRFTAFLLLTAALPAGAQQVGPPAPPPAPDPRCGQTPPDNEEEIVVCGRAEDEDSPYRIPRQFRNQEPIEDEDASWSSRVQDEESISRFSSQNVGPSGMSQRSRQVDCEWRAARQQARGERPDCTRQVNRIPLPRR